MRIKQKKRREGMVQGKSVGGTIADIAIVAVLAFVIFVCFVPMWHVLMMSIQPGTASLLTTEGIQWWVGDEINLEGYRLLFTETGASFADGNIFRGLFNTVLYMAVNVILGLVINVFAGYCLSRKTRLKKALTMICMFSMIFSAGTIPTYIVLRSLGLTGTMWSLMLPMCTNGMFMVMAMNAFLGVPEATVEAARIDGAGHVTTMFRVMLPQAMGLIIVIMINTAILHWNSWFQANIYVADYKELWPMQLWIRDLINNSQTFMQEVPRNYNKYLLQFCVIIVSTIPILVAFPFFYKKLEQNAVAGAVKG